MVSFSAKNAVIFSIIFVGLGIIAINAEAESNIIPNWVKNTASWWAEDQINETEYVTSLQYLIDQGIIKVNTPISNVFATDVAISDEQRAQSFEVHVYSEHYDLDETYYTFIQFVNINDASGTPRGTLVGIPEDPEFILGSLPSSDKTELYEYISKTLEPNALIELLEVNIDVSVLSGNGQTIQTWEYNECTLLDYVVFLDFNKENFRWSQTDEKEIREVFAFQCQGIDFTV